MKKIGILTGLILLISPCRAQQAELDSLLGALKAHTREDTLRLDLLNNIAFDYSDIDPGKGLAIVENAIGLAEKLGDKIRLATAFNYKGLNFDAKGEDSIALIWHGKALSIYTQTGDKRHIASTLNNLAIVYVNMSDYGKALEYHEKAYGLFEEIGDSLRMANSLNNRGVVYMYLADYPKELECFLKALAIMEKLGKKSQTGHALSNIGIAYKNLNNLPRALEYQEKALAIFRETGNKISVADALGNIGTAYDELAHSPLALEYYRQALALNKALDHRKGIANDLINMGSVYLDQARYDSALDYIRPSMILFEQLKDKNGQSAALHYLGVIYSKAPTALLLGKGIAPSKRWTLAIEAQEKSIRFAKEIQASDKERDAWAGLSETYTQQKRFDKALHAYQEYIRLRDTILNDEKKQEITRREMEFEFDKKETLLKAEHDQRQTRSEGEINRQRLIRNAIIAGAALLSLAALTVFFFYKKKRDAESNQKEAELKAEVADTEMKALRVQMNPHFIFNSLNSISDYISRNDLPQADFFLTRFASLMRMVLENAEKKEVSLADDLKALRIYMEIESLRLKQGFLFGIHVEEEIDPENTLLPPLILQPFVENSIWHGLAKKKEKGRIDILIRKAEETIICTIEDNGIGRNASDSPLPGKTSLGMKITRARIDILNKTGLHNAEIKITDLPEGTRAEIRLPYKQRF